MMREVIVLVDPVTEWKEVVASAKNLHFTTSSTIDIQNPVVVAVKFASVPPQLQPFLPSKSALLEAGVDHVVTMHHRDVSACTRDIQVLVKGSYDDSKIVCVVPLSEMAVDVSDLLAACLEVPHNPIDRLTSRRDKGIMKEVVAAAGLRVAQHTRVSNQAELQRALHNGSFSLPVVVKTPKGFSTTDVFICHTTEEAEQALRTICGSNDDGNNIRLGPDGSPVHQALLEEYIHGTEFAVNLMVLNHTLCVTDMWQYRKDGQARYEMADCGNPHDPTFVEVVTYASQVAQAVGVKHGAAHVELKAVLGEDGEFHNPVMIEVGARLSGGRKATMARAIVQDWVPFTNLILSHCGLSVEERTADFSPQQFARHLFFPVDHSGTISKLQVDTSGCTTVELMVTMMKEGDTVQRTSDIVSCAGFVWLVGEKSQVQDDTKQIRSTFQMKIE